MNKQFRQYVGIAISIVIYYIVHEGAHLLVALICNNFKSLNFMGIGVQIDVYADSMSDIKMGIFCLAGAVATLIAAWILIVLRNKICKIQSKTFKAAAYYVTIAMMFIDPIYLGLLCNLFGKGDMNGISLLIPELAARVVCVLFMLLHAFVFIKLILPTYRRAFETGDSK